MRKKRFTLKAKAGFTLIEILVTIMIIGILTTIVTFTVRQAQQSARDGKRQSDLETIAAGLEIYRADCNQYPSSSNNFLTNGTLSGSGAGNCTGTYISSVPPDPSPSRRYSYTSSGSSYVLCAALEVGGSTVSGCGSCGSTCNYKISRP